MESPRHAGVAWLTWAAATAAALVFVLLLGSNVPYWDEWELVPAATGHQPITLDFLWSQHNEHRIPLARLIYLGLFAVTRDFRAGMVFQVLALSAAAALLIEAARRVRGRASWTDSLFPVLLLNPGHAENLLWSFQIALALFPVFLAATLAAVAALSETPSRRELLAVALPMLVAPLCGAPGVVLALVTGAWLLWLAARPRASHGTRRWLAGCLGFACWGMVALYMYGYQPNAGHPRPAGMRAALRAVAEVTSLAFGAGGGWHWHWLTPVVLALAASAALGALAWWWRFPRQRVPAEGLLAMAAAVIGLVLAIGWGRSGFGPGAGFAGRYAALAAPVVCWIHLAWCRLPWPRVGRAIQAASVLLAVLLYPDNFAHGRQLGEQRRAGLQALVRDVRRPLSLAQVASRHLATVYPDPGLLEQRLGMLRPRRLGPFSRARDIATLRQRFPFVTAPLVAVHEGLVAAHPGRLASRRAIILHADGELAFDVRPGTTHASGLFGLGPGFASVAAAPGAPPYDGTRFTAEFRPDEGPAVELFNRTLDPLRNPDDRGLSSFRLSLPGSAGTLVLATLGSAPGAPLNQYGDWGAWADIELR